MILREQVLAQLAVPGGHHRGADLARRSDTRGQLGRLVRQLGFSDALALVRQNPGGIDHVTFHPSQQKVEFRLATGRTRTTVYPVDQSAYELQQLLEENEVAFDAKGTGSSVWWSILTSLLPFVLLFGFWVFLMRVVKQRTPTGQDPPETRPRY